MNFLLFTLFLMKILTIQSATWKDLEVEVIGINGKKLLNHRVQTVIPTITRYNNEMCFSTLQSEFPRFRILNIAKNCSKYFHTLTEDPIRATEDCTRISESKYARRYCVTQKTKRTGELLKFGRKLYYWCGEQEFIKQKNSKEHVCDFGLIPWSTIEMVNNITISELATTTQAKPITTETTTSPSKLTTTTRILQSTRTTVAVFNDIDFNLPRFQPKRKISTVAPLQITTVTDTVFTADITEITTTEQIVNTTSIWPFVTMVLVGIAFNCLCSAQVLWCLYRKIQQQWAGQQNMEHDPEVGRENDPQLIHLEDISWSATNLDEDIQEEIQVL